MIQHHTEDFIIFSDITSYDKFFISHALELDPVLCMLAGIIQTGCSFGYDSFQLLLAGGTEQSDAICRNIAGDGYKAVFADR